MKLDSVVAVLPVENFDEATAWYTTLFGRPADVEPMDDTAEWRIAENAWIQVCVDSPAGGTAVVIGVGDLVQHAELLAAAKIEAGEIVEYPGIVKTLGVKDPAGNKITFVEELSGA
ncbi:VOC family protein [Rhodococcus sp. P1Y]|uniref:VOC family protein n=1 Tax=Rhodococcus sp. P1Y TaxID=1302308 RepID=UPI001292F8DF|nr:VOC family protein [Rhodococcus sp. P1Y]